MGQDRGSTAAGRCFAARRQRANGKAEGACRFLPRADCSGLAVVLWPMCLIPSSAHEPTCNMSDIASACCSANGATATLALLLLVLHRHLRSEQVTYVPVCWRFIDHFLRDVDRCS